jgi:hypothetical protein
MKESAAAVLSFSRILRTTNNIRCDHLYLGTGIAFAKAVAEFFCRSRTLVNIMVNVPREETCEQSPAGFG